MWSCCCNIFPISCIGTFFVSSSSFPGLTFASQQLWVHLETFSQFSSWKGVRSHTLKQKQDPRDRLCSALSDSNLICTLDGSQIAEIFRKTNDWNREILLTNKVINFCCLSVRHLLLCPTLYYNKAVVLCTVLRFVFHPHFMMQRK